MWRGFEINYAWKDIETSRGVYDFSQIDGHLSYLKSRGARLIILVGTEAFSGNNSPAYLTGSEFGGGVYKTTGGWYNPVYWNAAVINRIVLLIQAIAARYDSDPNVEGINVIQESAYQDVANDPFNNGVAPYNDTAYKLNLEALALAARNACSQTMANLVINFPTGTDTDYWAASASTNGFGLGTTDVMPNNTVLTNYSYTYFAPRSGIIPLWATVDYPDYSIGSTVTQLYNYGRDNLKATHMIWNPGFSSYINNISAMMIDKVNFPQDVAGGLSTGCPSRFPACKN